MERSARIMSSNIQKKIINFSSSLSDQNWKWQLTESLQSVEDLFSHQLISLEEFKQLQELDHQFKVRITPYYAKLIQKNKNCPIRLQAIPHLGERDPILPQWAVDQSQKLYHRDTPWHTDAIGDVEHLSAPRLTHRYMDRAILHISTLCSVYCRFCFRKSHLSQRTESLYDGTLDSAFTYLNRHPEVRELILTGGDPLSVSDLMLKKIFEKASEISSIQVLRIHSRMPVTLPCRFTAELLDLLSHSWNFSISMVSHFNHPSELTDEATQAIHHLKRCGITLLNQNVLLKGVNDSTECLGKLFRNLYERGIIPYYIHHPDWTPGTFHFRTSIERGKALISALKGQIPGPALPDYILDIPQGFGKISLLDAQTKIVQAWQASDAHSKIVGALYQVQSPGTRKSQPRALQYLDLYSI